MTEKQAGRGRFLCARDMSRCTQTTDVQIAEPAMSESWSGKRGDRSIDMRLSAKQGKVNLKGDGKLLNSCSYVILTQRW